MDLLSEWEGFYLIVGAAAGALIGLQFVVMTLVAERPGRVALEAGRAFATPTVVHFSASLLVSALMRMPWPEAAQAAWAAGAAGLCGLVYMAVPVQRMRRQRAYHMDWEDRTFHILLPFAAYGLLVLSGLWGAARPGGALFGVGAAALLLLFVGIHNAWDAVAYQVYVLGNKPTDES
jgi:uncharacterized membrane protein